VNLRSAGALRSLVVRPGYGGNALVHVRLRNDSIVPEVDELRDWLDSAAGGVTSPTTFRSAALYPQAAARFEAAGFEVADRLVLLRADLTDAHVHAVAAHHGDRYTRTLRRHQFGMAARIDRAAFGDAWGHDATELAEICRATPVHAARFRVSASSRRIGIGYRPEPVAFAIAGASSEHGYLQRLAVDPHVQRRGHGRALTTEALRWMIRRRLPDCLVNTSVDNAAALGLYRSLGFTALDELLTVLQFEVRQV
jgi:ribosomal protein S18 acetylase RimI-like enzyme